MQSTDRCGKCDVLLDKSWMWNAHRCAIERRASREFIKKLILTEAILVTAVLALFFIEI